MAYSYTMAFLGVVAATLFSGADAHFFINWPPPIPGSGIKRPLDASGSDFPCHGVDLTKGPVTQLKAGSNYPLSFELGANHGNTAVHGGGSCQLALSYETDPAKLKDPANWKVIKSFIGGCPTDAKGNLPSAVMCPQSYPDCINRLNFTVPSEVKSSDSLLIFSWQNTIGAREQYSNCARVSVSGGEDKLEELPGLMVVNIPSINSCKSTESTILDYPNPGKYVEYGVQNYPLKGPVGCGLALSTSGNSSAAAAAAPAVSYAPATSTMPASTPPAPQQAAPAPPPASAPAPFANATTASAPAPGCANPCSLDGSVICIGTTQFGICDHGCALAQPLAAGTTCSGGLISKRGARWLPRAFSA